MNNVATLPSDASVLRGDVPAWSAATQAVSGATAARLATSETLEGTPSRPSTIRDLQVCEYRSGASELMTPAMVLAVRLLLPEVRDRFNTVSVYVEAQKDPEEGTTALIFTVEAIVDSGIENLIAAREKFEDWWIDNVDDGGLVFSLVPVSGI